MIGSTSALSLFFYDNVPRLLVPAYRFTDVISLGGRVLGRHQDPVMGPAQFATHCVAFSSSEISLSGYFFLKTRKNYMEIFEIRKGKSTPEFISQPDCRVFLKEMSHTLHGSYQPALLPQSVNG